MAGNFYPVPELVKPAGRDGIAPEADSRYIPPEQMNRNCTGR